MKPGWTEHTNRKTSDAHLAADDRWNIGHVLDGVFDVVSGLIELLFGALG